jgi:peroxidase
VLAFAARDSALFLSNYRINYEIPSGWFDGHVSLETETFQFLPPPFFNLSQLSPA